MRRNDGTTLRYWPNEIIIRESLMGTIEFAHADREWSGACQSVRFHGLHGMDRIEFRVTALALQSVCGIDAPPSEEIAEVVFDEYAAAIFIAAGRVFERDAHRSNYELKDDDLADFIRFG